MVIPFTGYEKAMMKHNFARMARGVDFGFKNLSAAKIPSLVIGSKSPTEFEPDFDCQYMPIEQETDSSHLIEYDKQQELDKSGKYLKVQYEEWSETYTATAYIQGKAADKPPVQEGDRITEKLSKAAATKIKKSSEYLSKHRRGYGAFLTLTFTPEERAEILACDARSKQKGQFDLVTVKPPKHLMESIGARVARFMNSMQQRRKEGQLIKLNPQEKNKPYIDDGKRAYLKGNKKGFEYVWVIENPKNENGEDNPHIHILTNWTVKKKNFRGWAHWMENLWGYGFCNIVKIRKPKSAAAYMAKAAGYISKGGDGSQGTVRGNRYSISKGARAPKAKTLGLFALQDMAKLIKKGYELGREHWPKEVYFHEHGLGVKGRAAWWDLANFFRRQGFDFTTAADFHAERMRQKIAAYVDEGFKHFISGFNYVLYTDNPSYETPQISLEEFNAIHSH